MHHDSDIDSSCSDPGLTGSLVSIAGSNQVYVEYVAVCWVYLTTRFLGRSPDNNCGPCAATKRPSLFVSTAMRDVAQSVSNAVRMSRERKGKIGHS